MQDDEQEVLTLIMERLVRGERQYGKLDLANLRRDPLDDALEEALDLAIYLAFQLVRARRERSP